MSEIPSDWSLAALLLFGGVFTVLAVGAAIFLAESWFQKMRQRREYFKIWQDRRLKIWQEQQRESFLRLGRDQQGFDDNEDIGLKLIERVIDFPSGALATRQSTTPSAILKGRRGKRIAACPVSIRMPAMIGPSRRAAGSRAGFAGVYHPENFGPLN